MVREPPRPLMLPIVGSIQVHLYVVVCVVGQPFDCPTTQCTMARFRTQTALPSCQHRSRWLTHRLYDERLVLLRVAGSRMLLCGARRTRTFIRYQCSSRLAGCHCLQHHYLMRKFDRLNAMPHWYHLCEGMVPNLTGA